MLPVNISFLVCVTRRLDNLSKAKTTSGIIDVIKTPLGIVLMLVIMLILASLTVASAISGALTAAAVSAAGLVVIVLILAMVNIIGK